MQAFIASLTAAMLFIHTVCGCCWHHAHQCEHGLQAGQPASCCHHHRHHDSDSQQHQAPCKGTATCKGTCVYIAPQKVKVEPPQWVAIDLVAVVPSLVDRQLEAGSWHTISSPPQFGPPLRPHLLHQVLLN